MSNDRTEIILDEHEIAEIHLALDTRASRYELKSKNPRFCDAIRKNATIRATHCRDLITYMFNAQSEQRNQ